MYDFEFSPKIVLRNWFEAKNLKEEATEVNERFCARSNFQPVVDEFSEGNG